MTEQALDKKQEFPCGEGCHNVFSSKEQLEAHQESAGPATSFYHEVGQAVFQDAPLPYKGVITQRFRSKEHENFYGVELDGGHIGVIRSQEDMWNTPRHLHYLGAKYDSQ